MSEGSNFDFAKAKHQKIEIIKDIGNEITENSYRINSVVTIYEYEDDAETTAVRMHYTGSHISILGLIEYINRSYTREMHDG